MNVTSQRTYTVLRTLFGGTFVAIATLLVLYAIEAAPGNSTANTALAWSCTINANSNSLEPGSPATITWTSSADVSYVTIDQIPGTQFSGSGSTTVYPNQTTTYVAHTHIAGSTDTLSCQVTVQRGAVTPPPTDECDTVTLSINDKTFTWGGSVPLECYNVSYCDGTGTGSVEGCWVAGTIMSLDKRIASVSACGHSCHKTATQTCPAPDAPKPTCSMTASPSSITEGATSTVSWMTTNVRSASFTGGISSTATSGSYVVAPAQGTTYTGTFVGDNNETITCSTNVAVNPKPPVYTPWCSLAAGPSTIVKGATTTLSWNSTDVSSGTLSGVGAINLTGTAVVSPATTTTYTATFAGKDGTTKTCTAVVQVTEPGVTPAPVCTMNISPSSVHKGESAILTWTSANAVRASIPGVSSTALNGSSTIAVYNNTSYIGTFTAADGRSVTCTAAVSVATSGGGGGSCLNCGDSDTKTTTKHTSSTKEPEPSPNITLSKTITKVGSFITLDKVPYTGFEASPMVTLFFWLAVLALSAGIAYVVTRYRPMSRIRAALATVSEQEQSIMIQEPIIPVRHTRVLPSVQTTEPVRSIASVAAPSTDDGAGMIEDTAHRDNILLSPEATRKLQSAIAASGRPTEEFLQELFDNAKSAYPREDGWILLSRERADALLSRHAVPTQATPAPAPVAPSVSSFAVVERPIRVAPQRVSEMHESAPQASQAFVEQKAALTSSPALKSVPVQAANDVPARFIEHVARNEQQKTFDLLRQMTAKGVAPEVFIARVVRELDEIYKHRLEGNHKPNAALAAVTATWSNGDFEAVLGMLVECIDFSYSSSRIGTKVALAKVFEYFGKK